METTLLGLIITALSLIVMCLSSVVIIVLRKEKLVKPDQFPGHRNPPNPPEQPVKTEFSADEFISRPATLKEVFRVYDKIYDAKKEILEAILILKSAIDLSTTNEIAEAVERLQEEKEKKATENKKSEYEIVEFEGKKYEKVPTKPGACWSDDGEYCSRVENCLPAPPYSMCDGYYLREIKEKEE